MLAVFTFLMFVAINIWIYDGNVGAIWFGLFFVAFWINFFLIIQKYKNQSTNGHSVFQLVRNRILLELSITPLIIYIAWFLTLNVQRLGFY